MCKYKYFSTHLQVFKQKVNLNNTSLYTLSLSTNSKPQDPMQGVRTDNIGSVLASGRSLTATQ